MASDADLQKLSTLDPNTLKNMPGGAQALQMVQQYKDNQYSGQPTRPEFQSLIDPATGQLKSQYQITPQVNANQVSNMPGFQSAWAGINPNTQGLDMFRKQALSTGPSAWAQMQANEAAKQNASSQAGARANLAMTGGLNSGARERLAIAGANAGNEMQQGIRAQDATNKQQMLAQLPGMENQALQPAIQKANAWQGLAQQESAQNQQNQQFNAANNMNAQNINAQNAIGQNTQLNAANLNAYNQQMAAWGAGKTADATAKSGQK